MTIDSDKNINIQGRVSDIVRGRPDISDYADYFLGDMVTLAVKSAEHNYFVDLPIALPTDFELMPYQNSLVGADVNYSVHFGNGKELTKHWKMEILSGSLAGRSYTHKSNKSIFVKDIIVL